MYITIQSVHSMLNKTQYPGGTKGKQEKALSAPKGLDVDKLSPQAELSASFLSLKENMLSIFGEQSSKDILYLCIYTRYMVHKIGA